MRKKVYLWSMPYQVMLIVDHPSGVIYFNQVCGNACLQAEQEGVLAPVELAASDVDRIMELSYRGAALGLDGETAEHIDGILAASPSARHIHVDRERMHESCEAWVYVIAETPGSVWTSPPHDDGYFGDIYGFGRIHGVLTWPNSD